MSDNIKARVLMLKGEKGDTGDSDYQPAVDALGKRIDNLILSSGTESSAEVVDARNGYDGTAYDTLGTAIRTQVNNLTGEISDLFICTEDNNLWNLMRKLDAGFVQGNFTSTTETDDLYWCKMAKPLGGQNLYIVADDNVMYYIAKYSSITGKFTGYVDDGINYKRGNYSLPFVYGVDYRVRVRPLEDGNKLKPDNCGIKIYTTAFEDVNSYTLANEQCVRTQIKNIHIDENYYKTQGMCILNGIAYIVRNGDSDDSKIIAYDIANDNVVSETIVNVGHGNSLATDGIYIYCCSTGYIYKFAVDSYLLSLIESYDVTEHNFIAMTNFGKNTFILLDSKTNAMYQTTDFKIFYKISNVYTRPNKGEIQASKQSIAYDGKYVYLIISEWDYTFIYKYTNHLRGVCLYYLNTKRYYEAESMYIYNNKMYVAENTMEKDGKCFLNIISTVEECLESIYS